MPTETVATPPSPQPWGIGNHPGKGWGTDWRELVTTGGEFSPAFVGILQHKDAAFVIATIEQLRQAKALLCYALPEIADAAAEAEASGDDRRADDLLDLANDIRSAVGYPREP